MTDIQANDQNSLHQTAIGQVLAFTLQALATKPPSQEWHNTAHDELSTWKVEYLDILQEIPETIQSQGQPTSNYQPSHWKIEPRRHNTWSRTRCQPGMLTPKHSSMEGSSSEEEHHSLSTAAAAYSQASCKKLRSSKSDKQQSSGRHGKMEAGQNSQKNAQVT